MTTTQVVKTSVAVTNRSFQNYTHVDDHTRQTTDTPGFKPFTIKQGFRYIEVRNKVLFHTFYCNFGPAEEYCSLYWELPYTEIH